MTTRYNPERRAWKGISYKMPYRRIRAMKQRILDKFWKRMLDIPG